jgi:hypothetical protein
MEYFIVSNLNENECNFCGGNYKHRKIFYKTAYEGLKEVECLTECATCRSLLRRKKEIDLQLKERKELFVNKSWSRFLSKFTEMKKV